jgi:hypothetical protein
MPSPLPRLAVGSEPEEVCRLPGPAVVLGLVFSPGAASGTKRGEYVYWLRSSFTLQHFLLGLFLGDFEMNRLFALAALASVFGFASADTLYFVNDANHDLYSIDPNTQSVTDIGNMGIDGSNFTFGDLTYDSANSTMYYSGGRGDDNVYTVNLTTGAATLVGADNVDDMFALGYDPATNSLYGGAAGGSFGSISMANGVFTFIGGTGAYNEGLTYDTLTGQMILSNDANIYSIDVATGATTLLGSPGLGNDNGITFDALRNVFWDYNYNGQLFEIDASTYGVLNTYNPGPGEVSSIAYVPTSTPEPATVAVLGVGLLGFLRRRKNSR